MHQPLPRPAFSARLASRRWRYGALACAAAVAVVAALSLTGRKPQKPPGDPIDIITTDFYYAALHAHQELDRFIPPGSIILIGDSIIEPIDGPAIDPRAVNLAISGDSTGGMAHRATSYRSLSRAAAVVLEGGINDIRRGAIFDAKIAGHYRDMMKAAAGTPRIFMVGILPIDERSLDKSYSGYNDRIAAVNAQLRALCASEARCRMVDTSAMVDNTGNLRTDFTRDGRHLNAVGLAAMRRVLSIGVRD